MVRLIVTVGGILVDLGGLKYKYKYKISYKYNHKCLWSVRLIVTVRGIAVPALDASLGSLLSARFHSTSQFKIQIQIHVRYFFFDENVYYEKFGQLVYQLIT